MDVLCCYVWCTVEVKREYRHRGDEGGKKNKRFFRGGDSKLNRQLGSSTRLQDPLANEFQLVVDNVIYNPFRNRLETIKKVH